jgi:hypothetical protein
VTSNDDSSARSEDDPTEEVAVDHQATCAICGRALWSDGLPPARDGDSWICGDCDQARNFETLVL